MADDSLVKRINYEYPYYEQFVEPRGALTMDPACHACFYYGMLAFKARLNAGNIESQTIVYKVGETPSLWREPRDAEIAKSVALIYALESPDDFLKFRAQAWAQAKMLGVELPVDIFTVTPDRKLH